MELDRCENSLDGEELSSLEGDRVPSVGSDEVTERETEESYLNKKKFKRGVVYLSFIPPGMTPRFLRLLLSKYAPVGRMYLQVVKQKEFRRRKDKADNFSEGWVEFLKKRHAKQIALLLNNTKIGGKKSSKFHDYLWNLKYLSRFKWVHLVERLSYERAVFKQKMRNEISQAKKVANHFKETVDKEERLRKKKKQNIADDSIDTNQNSHGKTLQRFAQRETQEEKIAKKSAQKREDFLKSLFG